MLLGGGAFKPQAKAMASVVLTQLIEQGTPLDAGAVITQIVEMMDDGSGGAGAGADHNSAQIQRLYKAPRSRRVG